MNFKSHALSLAEFTSKYSPLWNKEIMNEYPESIDDYPREWIDLLDSLTDDELFDVDCKRPVEKLKGTSFETFVQTIKTLSDIPKITPVPELPLEDWAFQGVKKKKRHEIQKIVPVLKKVRDEKKFDYVVDIGGGVGHLSRVLSHYHAIPSISIDQNVEFQEIGRGRLQKFRKIEGAQDVTFMNITFGKKEDDPELGKIFNEHSLGLGLHTCGALANTLIQNTIDHHTMGLLSFGCCYHTLKANVDFPLSTFYKEQHFPVLNLYGFTLATRSHAETTLETYKTKERVKKYRYALHLFLMKNFGKKSFIEVGECHLSTYWEPFHVYISEKLNFLKLEHNFTNEDFDHFYESTEIQKDLREMFLCNVIRWQLGRVLEIYLQVDRCLYLEANGFEVKLEQYFEEALSPRNLGILALQKEN
ncbi:MAG: methyltransferase [Rhizobacter sp.]|nr:methyltransferase [Bacteriovorax sp.]